MKIRYRRTSPDTQKKKKEILKYGNATFECGGAGAGLLSETVTLSLSARH